MGEQRLIDTTPVHWRNQLRIFWINVAVLASSVAGLLMLIWRPEWLEYTFAAIAWLSLIGTGIAANMLIEFRRENRLWFLNRPAGGAKRR